MDMPVGTDSGVQGSAKGPLGVQSPGLDKSVTNGGPLGQNLDEALNSKWVEAATGIKPDVFKNLQINDFSVKGNITHGVGDRKVISSTLASPNK